jgi:pimeloyl-ACP methyl ester carboxylesterase
MTARYVPLLLFASLTLPGCAFSIDRFAQANRFDTSVVEGAGYRHVLFTRRAPDNGHRLHIYIEGDGIPWLDGREPALDPTPRDPLALRLMAEDGADVAFVGRPCYFGLAQDGNCRRALWTHGRYSDEVVSSMVEACRRLIAAGGYTETVLVGYSGGGSIARLMAPDVPGLVGLLTVNANLDTDAWVSIHDYQPLTQSTNPAAAPRLHPGIVHVQAIGAGDRIVPPSVTRSYQDTGNDVVVWRYQDFDHVCCWLDVWQDILAKFDAVLANVRAREE